MENQQKVKRWFVLFPEATNKIINGPAATADELEPLLNRSQRSPAGRRLRKSFLRQARRVTGFDGEMMDVIALYASGPLSGRQTVRQDRARRFSRKKEQCDYFTACDTQCSS